MKKIILIVFFSLMFSNIGFAKTTLLWVDRIKGKNSSDYLVSTICVDGYTFVVTKSGTTDSISMVQFFERKITADGKIISVPSYC